MDITVRFVINNISRFNVQHIIWPVDTTGTFGNPSTELCLALASTTHFDTATPAGRVCHLPHWQAEAKQRLWQTIQHKLSRNALLNLVASLGWGMVVWEMKARHFLRSRPGRVSVSGLIPQAVSVSGVSDFHTCLRVWSFSGVSTETLSQYSVSWLLICLSQQAVCCDRGTSQSYLMPRILLTRPRISDLNHHLATTPS